MTNAGRLEAIWIKRFRKGPMDPVPEVLATKGEGLRGNANQGGRRQVTLIEKEVFKQLQAELGRDFDPSVRRANLMVSATCLKGSTGKILRIGGVRIQLLGETRPCERMDEAVPGLRVALDPDWRAGAYGIILNTSAVRVGDEVAWEE